MSLMLKQRHLPCSVLAFILPVGGYLLSAAAPSMPPQEKPSSPQLPAVPALPLPVITVAAVYPGAGAQAIADTVAVPIEHAIVGLERLKRLVSRCTHGGKYTLQIHLTPGTDLTVARVLVQDRVSLALPLLPDSVKNARVSVKAYDPPAPRFCDLGFAGCQPIRATSLCSDDTYRIPYSHGSSGHHSCHDTKSPRNLRRSPALDTPKAIASRTVVDHLNDHLIAKLDTCACHKAVDVNTRDDDLFTHLAGTGPVTLVTELLQRFQCHDVELSFGTLPLTIGDDATTGLQRSDFQRNAGVMVRRAWVDSGRSMDDTDDFTHRTPLLAG
jgi:hypothetical protein